jgi:ribonuclease HII
MERRETQRLRRMWEYEDDSHTRGYTLVAGVDEAGRGPLAGPVVAAAVILPKGKLIEHCNDSKLLTPTARRQLCETILSDSEILVGIGVVSSVEIDEVNILRATIRAMTLAVQDLPQRPEYVLVDGLSIPGLGIENRAIIKGDSKSISIAAASIIAKKTRDDIMEDYDRTYREYGFARHKGYGTAAHLEMLKKHGPCPIHRRSFMPVKTCYEELKLW